MRALLSHHLFLPLHSYYSQARPNVTGLPSTITYGGNYFNVSLPYASLYNEPMNVLKTKVVLERTGFHTHAMGMGQRHVELEFAFTVDLAGDAVLSVSQLPPNPAILGKRQAAIRFLQAFSDLTLCCARSTRTRTDLRRGQRDPINWTVGYDWKRNNRNSAYIRESGITWQYDASRSYMDKAFAYRFVGG